MKTLDNRYIFIETGIRNLFQLLRFISNILVNQCLILTTAIAKIFGFYQVQIKTLLRENIPNGFLNYGEFIL